MVRRFIVILILTLLLTSCGGAPAPTQAPVPTEPATETEMPTQPIIAGTNTLVNTPTPASTSTAVPTETPAPTRTPAFTPTDTPLPTLALPTEVVNPPARQVWDGDPTYPGDSTPGFSFRVTYVPAIWALTTDQFGFPALGHRTISNCVISVTSGRGLPPSMSVEHEMLQTENITFDVGTAYENGVKQFVTFTGGDGTIITAFQVSFQDESDACVKDAVDVISTLTSVPASRATPAPSGVNP
jgi:hypothetical protein